MIVVLVVASGAAWESLALTALGEDPGIVVLKRCVDVEDLMAAASSGQAQVAVVGLDAPGLDTAAVDHLRQHAVRPVAVVPHGAGESAALRAARIGIRTLVPETDLGLLAGVVAAGEPDATPGPETPADSGAPHEAFVQSLTRQRVIAVWGPAGAPGRTTLALGIASEVARRRAPTLVVDADPHGGAIAQHLGIVDEVSGLLAASRLAGAGQLADELTSVQRSLGDRLAVVTGLPRADRWAEVRPGTLEHLLELAVAQGYVVVDTGFSLEQDLGADLGARPARNHLTLAAVAEADDVVLVGGADPVGLSRLARALVEVREVQPATPVWVVVNRMRPTLGWAEKDVAAMIAGFAGPRGVAGLHFLPDDQPAVDRALVNGNTLADGGESAIGRGIVALVDALVPESARTPSATTRATRARPRRAGRGHRR